MGGMDTIRSLRQSVERIGDSELKHEMLSKVDEVHDHLATTHEQLHARQAELDAMRARGAGSTNIAAPATEFYDPPI